jgi:hypothetical protein
MGDDPDKGHMRLKIITDPRMIRPRAAVEKKSHAG